MNGCAPIVLFVYNRPWHTRQCLESLAKNELADRSALYIFADGPKENITEDQRNSMEEVRRVIRERKWCKEVHIFESDKNRGLANSVIQGVTEVIRLNGKVIVLEDDLVLSRGFLKYMNDALLLYKDYEKVMHISGYVYPVAKKLPETFFYEQTTCWGWGTWERAWQKLNVISPLAPRFSREEITRFNLDSSYDFYELLQLNESKASDTWAVKWYATTFLEGGVSLHPGKSLVNNIGHAGGGTHSFNSAIYHIPALADSVNVSMQSICVDVKSRNAIVRYFRNTKGKSFVKKAIQLFKYKFPWFIPSLLRTKPILWNDFRSLSPISRQFGLDRGKSIDRYYIERFLEENSWHITHNVLEVGDTAYTGKFGRGVLKASIISADRNSFAAIAHDLSELSTLPASSFDCFICTQTLNFIYDFQKAIQGIHYVLKENGHALVTVAGVCQISRYDSERWGDYWRFTPMSMQKAFSEVFGEKNVVVDYYGNCLSAISLLKGLASEELTTEELNHKDEEYPVVITIKARKR